jgi:hypothetical protein
MKAIYFLTLLYVEHELKEKLLKNVKSESEESLKHLIICQ